MTEIQRNNAEQLQQAVRILRTQAYNANYGPPRQALIRVELRNPEGYPAPYDPVATARWAKTTSPAIAECLSCLLEAFIPTADEIAKNGSDGYQGLDQLYYAVETAKFINAQQEAD